MLKQGGASGKAGAAQAELTKYLEQWTPQIKQFDTEYKSAKNSQRITSLMEDAANSQATNALPSMAKAILKSPSKSKYFDDEIREALTRVAQGGEGFRGAINQVAKKANTLPALLGSMAMSGGMSAPAHIALQMFASKGHEKTLRKLDEAIRLKPDLQKRLDGPLSSFGQAATEVQTTPSARNISRLTLAASNLSNNLGDADINFTKGELLKMLLGSDNGMASSK